jgi:hypothetical protein
LGNRGLPKRGNGDDLIVEARKWNAKHIDARLIGSAGRSGTIVNIDAVSSGRAHSVTSSALFNALATICARNLSKRACGTTAWTATSIQLNDGGVIRASASEVRRLIIVQRALSIGVAIVAIVGADVRASSRVVSHVDVAEEPIDVSEVREGSSRDQLPLSIIDGLGQSGH